MEAKPTEAEKSRGGEAKAEAGGKAAEAKAKAEAEAAEAKAKAEAEKRAAEAKPGPKLRRRPRRRKPRPKLSAKAEAEAGPRPRRSRPKAKADAKPTRTAPKTTTTDLKSGHAARRSPAFEASTGQGMFNEIECDKPAPKPTDKPGTGYRGHRSRVVSTPSTPKTGRQTQVNWLRQTRNPVRSGVATVNPKPHRQTGPTLVKRAPKATDRVVSTPSTPKPADRAGPADLTLRRRARPPGGSRRRQPRAQTARRLNRPSGPTNDKPVQPTGRVCQLTSRATTTAAARPSSLPRPNASLQFRPIADSRRRRNGPWIAPIRSTSI
jgi:hypothetical protein